MKSSVRMMLGSCLMLQALPIPFMGLFSTGTPLLFSDQPGLHQSFDLALDIAETTQPYIPGPWRKQSAVIVDAVVNASNRYEIDPLLIMAVIKHESRFNPEARGRHGEIGLMQIKPSTALWLIEEKLVPIKGDIANIDTVRELLRDPKTNVLFGAAYLAHLRGTFRNRTHLYLAAYNMGAMNVKSRLRDGVRPHIYSDHINAELKVLGQGLKKARRARVAQLTRRLAADDLRMNNDRTLGLN